MPYCKIDTFEKYYHSFYPNVQFDLSNIRSYAHKLHNGIRSKAKLKEAEKPLFVGGLLLALSEPNFKNEYPSISNPDRLASRIITAIEDKLKDAKIQEKKRSAVVDQFRFIGNKTMLLKKSQTPKGDNKFNSHLHNFLFDIDEHLGDISLIVESQDIMGEFYNEFIRYTGGDGKGLGIVLTPSHITELFTEIADIHKNSRVIDICMGTGGFLVSSMVKMLTEELTIPEMQTIRNSNLYGIETQPDIFALACVNMFIRGDGRANMIKGDCHDNQDISNLKKCTVALINPPYSQKEKGESELEFIFKSLEMLEVDGKCVAIVPLSCTFGDDEMRKNLLKQHTLESVMIMPKDLFPKEGTHTCIMTFLAHRPHDPKSNTWFSLWDDDGFQKFKNMRIDRYDKWNTIKKGWLKDYKQKANNHKSLSKHVKGDDEWSAFAYLPTDYSLLSKNSFVQVIREHKLCSLRKKGTIEDDAKTQSIISTILGLPKVEQHLFEYVDDSRLDITEWGEFLISQYFDISGSKTTPIVDLFEYGIKKPNDKKYPYVTTRETNTGIDGYYPFSTSGGGVLSIDSATIGHTKYRHEDFSASDHVEILSNLDSTPFNKYIAIYIETILNFETFRYGYGRKFNQIRIANTKIRLPKSLDGKPDWQYMESFIKSIDRLDWMDS